MPHTSYTTRDARRWWTVENQGMELSQAVVNAAHEVDEATVERQQAILENYCLYGDMGSSGLGSAAKSLPYARRLSHNIIANATDALVSEVTQTQPRPMAIPRGGTYSDQIKCRKLTTYWDAKFLSSRVREIAPQVVRDAVISGLGVMRAYEENEEVHVERIFPLNLLVDDRNADDVMPRVIYLRRFIDRWFLQQLYPEQSDMIEHAEPPDPRYSYNYDSTQDLIEVIEAWHLPSRPSEEGEETDGRHVIAIREAVLVEEDWRRDSFPLAFLRAVPSPRGFWGESLVRRAAPSQFELNKLLRRIQESQHLFAAPRIFVSRQSKIVKQHIQNRLGTIVEHDGPPPTFLTPPSMAGDVYQHIDRLSEWIFREMGVSEMSATSAKPVGLESGRALRIYNDVQSRRFINFERAFERLHVDLAHQIAYIERSLSLEDPSHEVVFEAENGRQETIPWREIDLEKDILHIQVFPASALPTTPAGKLQALEEMVAAGILDQETFYHLADIPDFDSIRDTVVAPVELLRKRFDMMLENGEYLGPEPYMDLTRGMRLCGLYVQKAELHGAPEERLELLRQWIPDAQAMIKRAAQMAAADAPPLPPPGPELMPPPGELPMGPEGMPPPMPGVPPGLPPEAGAMPPPMPPPMPPVAPPMPPV